MIDQAGSISIFLQMDPKRCKGVPVIFLLIKIGYGENGTLRSMPDTDRGEQVESTR